MRLRLEMKVIAVEKKVFPLRHITLELRRGVPYILISDYLGYALMTLAKNTATILNYCGFTLFPFQT